MPGHEHGPSIKNPRVYEALRRKGYSKEKAARISNAMDGAGAVTDGAQRVFATHYARALRNKKSDDEARQIARSAVRKHYAEMGDSISDGVLPIEVREMPAAARSIFRAAFSKARKEDKDDLAAVLAFRAVQKLYKRVTNEEGEEEWVTNEEAEQYEKEEFESALEAASEEDDPESDDDEEKTEGDEPDDDDDDDDDKRSGESGGEEYSKTTKTTETTETRRRAAAAAAAAEKDDDDDTDTGDSMIEVQELFSLDAKGFRLTGDGFLVATPRVARTGIQIYKGYEVGRHDMDEVRVYRPENEVFSQAAMSSLAHRTITLNHPYVRVDASNWKEHTVGHSSEPVARDGDFIRVPLVLMDAHAISAAQSGHSQLSVGYGAKLKWEKGVTPDGQMYDAMQQEIRANHIALVTTARGGDKLAIGDDADELCEDGGYFDREFSTEQRKKMAKKGQAMPHGGFPIAHGGDLRNAIKAIGRAKNPGAAKAHIKKRARALGLTKLLPESWDSEGDHHDQQRRSNMSDRTLAIDGVNIALEAKDAQILERHLKQLGDTAANLQKLLGEAQTEIEELTDKASELTKTIATKDGEIVVLNKKVEDGKVTPVMLDDFCRKRMDVVGRAIKVLGDGYAFDTKTDAVIRREVVASVMGDQAKDMSDDAIVGAFNVITKQPDVQDGNRRLANSFSRPPANTSINDAAAKAYNKRNDDLQNAWKKGRKPFGGQPAA